MIAYKVFTKSLCPPIQGGPPVWDSSLPYMLPRVTPSTSSDECGAGWNACRTPEDALRIAGLWPDGRPSRLFRVETEEEVIERGDKLRAATWTIVEELSTEPSIRALSKRWFGEHAGAMAKEQIAWASALGRPLFRPDEIGEKLAAALDARKLPWKLRRFDSARAAWDARVAWVAWDARVARAAWDAWDARAAWDAWDAWDARATRAALDAWDAQDARAALDAWDAQDACIVSFAARSGWISHREDRLTVGLRDAYECGLAIAIPTGPNELGWATVERKAPGGGGHG